MFIHRGLKNEEVRSCKKRITTKKTFLKGIREFKSVVLYLTTFKLLSRINLEDGDSNFCGRFQELILF